MLLLVASILMFNRLSASRDDHDKSIDVLHLKPNNENSSNHQRDHADDAAAAAAPINAHAAPLPQMQREADFLKTLKSCLPQNDKHCKTYIPPRKEVAQRVVLVTPPGRIGEKLFQVLKKILEEAKADGLATATNLFHKTSIPPYGYGKTHGWTRIIRFVPTPLAMGVADTLQTLHDAQLSNNEVANADDVHGILRQYIRYHCRLSHIAAHTSLWTISTDDIMGASATSTNFEHDALAFFGFSAATGNRNNDSNMQEKSHTSVNEAFQSLQSHLSDLQRSSSTILLQKQQSSSSPTKTMEELLAKLDQIMDRELSISKNLSAWPCQSLWTVGEEDDDPLKLGELTKHVAQALSPDCGTPLVECFVKRDKCEAAGDGVCK